MELTKTIVDVLAGNFKNDKIRISVRPNVVFSCRELNGKIRVDFHGEKPEVEIKFIIYINVSLEYLEIDENEILVKAVGFSPVRLKISDFLA